MKLGWIGVLLAGIFATAAEAQQRIVVGYFNEWPLPAHYGRQTGAFDAALGTTVIWQAFNDSQTLINAIDRGEVQFGLGVGMTPVIAAAIQGKSISIIDIAVVYTLAETCVTRPRLNISPETPEQLLDIDVAIPIGTHVHYTLERFAGTLGLDPKRLQLVNMSPQEATGAYLSGKIDAACAWGASQATLNARGRAVFDDAFLAQPEIAQYDLILTEDFYAQANAELVVSFLRVINEINDDFNRYPDPILPYLPTLVNLSADSSNSILNLFTFPSVSDKIDGNMMTETLMNVMQGLSEFYLENATLSQPADDLERLVNTRYLQELHAESQQLNLTPQQQEDDPESGEDDPAPLAQ